MHQRNIDLEGTCSFVLMFFCLIIKTVFNVDVFRSTVCVPQNGIAVIDGWSHGSARDNVEN